MPDAVHVVHCIDTEGPAPRVGGGHLRAPQDDLRARLEPSPATASPPAGRRSRPGRQRGGRAAGWSTPTCSPTTTPGTRSTLMADCMSPGFRDRMPRFADGNGWIYNWFCVDHVDYDVNPRRRDIGYHNVFDHYLGLLRDSDRPRDGVHFHYHPHNFRREAHRCATHWWASSDSLQQILSPPRHRPAVVPGCASRRIPRHPPRQPLVPRAVHPLRLLEPGGGPTDEEDRAQSGLEGGRWGDWRRAPARGSRTIPPTTTTRSHGACRRWIARCLNVGTRYRLLGEDDVRQAFLEAQEGRPVVLAFTNHDFRDIRPDVDGVRGLLAGVAGSSPTCLSGSARPSTRCASARVSPQSPPCDLDASLRALSDSAHALEIRSTVPTFGPQPWLALKTVAGTYHHDNFDIDEPFHRWRYVFDEETFPLQALSAIGVAANNSCGVTTVLNLDPATGQIAERVLNSPADAAAGPAPER